VIVTACRIGKQRIDIGIAGAGPPAFYATE
jgi:hypothetical protein